MALTGQAKTDYQREYMRRRRSNAKGITNEGLTENIVIPDAEFTRLMATAKPGYVRVSKPGDADYKPQCETTRKYIEGRAAAL